MRLALATNWDFQLLENVKELPIHSMYGKLPMDIIGGGRPSSLLPHIDKEYAEKYIIQAHIQGIKFNYLMNAACLGNEEFIEGTENKILQELEWLNSIGVDYITVVVPYLLELIKKHFPQIKVVISIFSHVNSIQRAKFYEDLGADEIVIIQKFNRNFEFLKKLRESVKCDLEVLANTGCLFGCPYRGYHQNINAHASQKNSITGGFYIDYPFINCSYQKLAHPEELIKSRWIRPEDLHYYEEIGIDKFKLMERTKSTQWLTRAAKSYAERKYDGNLADILSLTDERTSQQKRTAVKYFKQPDYANLNKLKDVSEVLGQTKFHIDNTKLGGFLNFFKHHNCLETSCDECRYCNRVSAKACSQDVDMSFVKQKFEKVTNDLRKSCFV